MKYVITWLLCGLLGLYLTVNYGNKREMGPLGAAMIVAVGPCMMIVGGIVAISKSSPCLFNCQD